MSHQPERKEKDCLNCGTIVEGRYCHVCGQENVVTHQSFAGLTKHFIYDIFHFDGKFFDTLVPLFTRPGLVAKQYTSGRRVKFLDPIRMYLFTSALFFLFFFSLAKPKDTANRNEFLTVEKRVELANELKEEAKKGETDSSVTRQIALLLDTVNKKEITLLDLGRAEQSNESLASRRAYDSVQKNLPAAERDNWLKRKVKEKILELNEKYRGRSGEALQELTEVFLHRLPYLLFISLPFFALILKLLYIRRKPFFYSDHTVFTLYHYIFSFLLLLLVFAVNALKKWISPAVIDYLILALFLTWLIYLYKAMRNFYGQSRRKTLGKFLLLNFLGLLVIVVLFVVFFSFSIFQL